MSTNNKEVVSERGLLAASSSMDSRMLPGAGPPLKREVEPSGEEKSDTTSSQITGSRSKRICLETAACTVQKDLSHNGSSTSSESHTEESRQFLIPVQGVDYSIADNLLKCANDVDALRLISNLDSRSPLCTAVKNKQSTLAELLISLKADVNALDGDGKPPLYYAIHNVDVQTTKLLLNNGAKVENFPEVFPLVVSKKSMEIVEALCQHGFDGNVRSEVGNNVLYSVVSTACEAILHDKRATEIHTTNADSVFNEFVYMFNLLLTFNVNVNLSNDAGSTPLHCSSMKGNLEISTFLLNKGANVNAQDNHLKTPLHVAVTAGHADVANLLLERGAQVNGRDTDGFTPLDWAVFNGHADVVKLLLERGDQVNCRDTDGYTPLDWAVFKGHADVVKLLLETGAQVNCRDPSGCTPLDWAAFLNKSRIIEILLRFGACVNSRTDKGKTALHIASEASFPCAVAIGLLLDNGADLSMKCERSYTPFDYAWGFDRALESCGDYYRNIVINGSHPRHDTIDAFFRHQVKMEAAGLNPTASSEGVLEDFYFECQLEVARMKSSFIASTNVSCFDILKKGSKCVAKYLKNNSIVLALDSEDYKREFPIYAGIIGFKFREGLVRKKLIERATCVFQRIRGWPEDCTAKVLDFLDDDDMKVFLDV